MIRNRHSNCVSRKRVSYAVCPPLVMGLFSLWSPTVDIHMVQTRLETEVPHSSESTASRSSLYAPPHFPRDQHVPATCSGQYRGTSLIRCGDSENACLFLTQLRNFPKNACLFLEELRNFSKNACLFLTQLRKFQKTLAYFSKIQKYCSKNACFSKTHVQMGYLAHEK